jgi:hypothetical protein
MHSNEFSVIAWTLQTKNVDNIVATATQKT